MESFSHSSVLFVEKDGKPMQFCMAPCEERKNLRPLVEHGSGVLSSKSFQDSIRLVPPGGTANSDNCVKSSYITACAQQNMLLPLNKYRVKNGEQNLEDLANDTTSDIDISGDTSHVFTVTAKDIQGRSRYLLSEDNAILRFLLEEGRYSTVNGNLVWKDMAMLEITKHSWQSMKDRYRKHILPNIGSYNLKSLDIARLQGILSHQVATKPSNQHSIKRFMDPCTNTSISPRRSKDSSDFSADIRSPPSSPNKQSTKSPRKCVSSRTQVVVTNGTNEGDSDQDSFDMELLKQATLEEEEDLTKSPPVKRSRTRNATRSDSKNLGNEDLIEINDDDSNRADGTSCSDNMNYNNSSSNKNGVVPHQTRSRTVEKAGSSQLSGSQKPGSPKHGKQKLEESSQDRKYTKRKRLKKASEEHEDLTVITEESSGENDQEKTASRRTMASGSKDEGSEEHHGDSDQEKTSTRHTKTSGSKDEGSGERHRNRSDREKTSTRHTKTSGSKDEGSGERHRNRSDREKTSTRHIKTSGSKDEDSGHRHGDDHHGDGVGREERDTTNQEESEEASQSLLPQVDEHKASAVIQKNKSRLRNFIMLDTQGSQSFSEGWGSVSSEPTMAHEDPGHDQEDLHAACQHVCDWLDVTPRQLLSVLYATNGSMSDAISWLLGETTGVVHWDLELDSKLLDGDDKDYEEVVEKMTEEATRARCQFLLECSD